MNALFDILCHQVRLMTQQCTCTSLPWTHKSTWIGFSAMFYLAPMFVSKQRASWALQALLCFASDYWWAGIPHVSHGMDRWFATYMVLANFPASPWAMLPLMFLFRSKRAVKQRKYNEYVFNHVLWHFTGPAVFLFHW